MSAATRMPLASSPRHGPVGGGGDGGSVYRRSSCTEAPETGRLRRVANTINPISSPTTPPHIKMMPMIPRSRWAGFQLTPHLRIAPMMMSAMLPPIVIDQPPPLAIAACSHASWVDRTAAKIRPGWSGHLVASLTIPLRTGHPPPPCEVKVATHHPRPGRRRAPGVAQCPRAHPRHPSRTLVKPRGWDITWGAQIDPRVVRLTGGGEVTDTKVAASRGDDGQVVGTPLPRPAIVAGRRDAVHRHLQAGGQHGRPPGTAPWDGSPG